MNRHTIIIHTLGTLLLLPLLAGQQEEAGKNRATDPPTAQQRPNDVDLGHGYVRRNGAIHFIGGGKTSTGADATRIDTPSQRVLKGFTDADLGPFKTCEGLDVASFEALSEEYARDNEHVYHKVISPGVFLVILLNDADPATFEVLARNLARDRNHVWVYDQIQPGADPANLELVDSGRVFKDQDSVHYQSEQITGADAASFRHLGSAYYADKNRAYWSYSPIHGADPATLEVLGDSFMAKDTSNVYRSGKLVPGLDVASVQLIVHDPIGHQILSDKNGIHLNTMTFPRSRPGKVEVIDNLTVKAGDLVLLVDTYYSLPVTVFKEDGKLMAETVVFDPTSREPLATMTAEVTAGGPKDIRTGPLPGEGKAPPVPDWQGKVFKRPDLVRRMIEAGKLIK
ncbi:MAG: DKNYY domain-containing protein [Verrucomicrobiales bacterium]|nr:DKNYY domain-containing protein [Verrucomicrobiales bacterium]